MRPMIRRAGELLRRSAYTVALTGAGISTPSGIPDFRSPRAGLWSHADPLDVASIWAFVERPAVFYDWFSQILRLSLAARPNPAHLALAQMEANHVLQTLITQNIDSLHQGAGSQRVVELHGHTRTATCLNCGCQVPAAPLWPGVLAGLPPPLCPECQGPLKPDVVLFGEPLPYEALRQAQQEALACELMLVIGTSLEVMPAADLPMLARRRGAHTVLINLTPTLLDDQFDVVIRADVVHAMEALRQELQDR